MFLIILTIFLVTLITYICLKPLIDNLSNHVPYKPKYIHSYIPLVGFGISMSKDPIEFIRKLYLKYGKIFSIYLQFKRWIYFYDEQTFLTKVIKSSDLSIDGFLIDFTVNGLDVNRQCIDNEDIQKFQLKQYHTYLVGEELEILNKRVHDSLIESMKNDQKFIENNQVKIANFFDLFGEFMLYAGSDGLNGNTFTNTQRNTEPNFYKLFQDFDKAFAISVFRIPFRKILFKSLFNNRQKFIERFSSLKINNGESNLIHAREELYRSDQFKHLFREYDINALQAALLWAAVANTAPMSCWSIVDLLLHPEALEAVKQELKENLPSSSVIYDKEILSKLKILESCINESIRRTLYSVATRQAVTDTTIECIDKTKVSLRKGDMLIYPAFIKHFDPTLFGSNPYSFQYDRFIKKSNQSKPASTMFFGCGTHMCPGRYWAINEIKILVALIIQHMDIEFINMTEQDKEEYRKKLPYDYSKFVSSGGPKKGYEYKFDIKYSYKNLDDI